MAVGDYGANAPLSLREGVWVQGRTRIQSSTTRELQDEIAIASVQDDAVTARNPSLVEFLCDWFLYAHYLRRCKWATCFAPLVVFVRRHFCHVVVRLLVLIVLGYAWGHGVSSHGHACLHRLRLLLYAAASSLLRAISKGGRASKSVGWIGAICLPLNLMLWRVHRGSFVLEIHLALVDVGKLAVYLVWTHWYTRWPVTASYVSISVTVDKLTHLPYVQKFRRNIGRVFWWLIVRIPPKYPMKFSHK
jgi:hypothetical protein